MTILSHENHIVMSSNDYCPLTKWSSALFMVLPFTEFKLYA